MEAEVEPTPYEMLYSPNHTFVHSPCRNEMTGKFGFTVRNLISTLLMSQCALASPFLFPFEYNDKIDESNVTFDFIVVGAGASGSVVTNRLTEIDSWNILLIEAGGDPRMSTDVPSSHYSAQKTQADWDFKTEPSFLYKGLVDEVGHWSAGKVLGGSSTIGRMVYHRGRPWDYEKWSTTGVKNWTWIDNLPFFEKTEETVYGAILYCGPYMVFLVCGTIPLAIKTETKPINIFLNCEDANTNHLREYLEALGYFSSQGAVASAVAQSKMLTGKKKNHKTHILDITIHHDDLSIWDMDKESQQESCADGFYYTLGTLKNGERVSAAKAYLSTIKKRKNFYVLKHATVTKVVINPTDHRAIGVEFLLANNKTRTVFANKEVILSAGAINTPKLLMLSGIGREEHLSTLGIPVSQNSRVGDNLQDHTVFLGLVYSVNVSQVRPIPFSRRRLDATYEYLTRRTGELSTIVGSIIVGFISFFGKKEFPNAQIWFEVFEQGDFGSFADFQKSHSINTECIRMMEEVLEEHDLLFIMPVLLSPKSNGTVRLRSSDPLDSPAIHSGYYMADEDIEIMLLAIRFGQNLAQSYNMMSIDPEIVKIKPSGCFDEAYDTDLYWKCMMFELTTTFNDYAGTARMGPPTEPTAVVNDRLQVYGVGNLRVIDASVMPFIPTTNCLGPSILIGERGADFIKKDWIVETKKNTSPFQTPPSESREIPERNDTTQERPGTTDGLSNDALEILKLIRPRT